MPIIMHENRSLHYLDEGKGTPLLLLHAFPLSAEMYRRQIEVLSRRCRVIAPDHRGFGQSAPAEEPAEMTALARDALVVLNSAGVLDAVVGGVSMGGYAAMAMLELAPERVRGLILADTQAYPDDEAGQARREETAQAVLAGGMRVLVDGLLPKLLAPSASPALRAEVAALILANPKEGAAAALRGMALRPDSHDLLAAYGGPALIVVGQEDELTPLPKAQAMAKRMPQAKLVAIAGAGHLANLEAPVAFNHAVEGFLNSLRG
jgi:pimeloyl-ACP methyl ester carboxylesterase